MTDPILVTGAARSGTSMTAGIIHLCGAFGGKLSGPTTYNKKGMFENGTIRNELVKPFFSAIGADRLLFGSDLQDLPIAWGLGPILLARLSRQDKQLVLGENLRRILERYSLAP